MPTVKKAPGAAEAPKYDPEKLYAVALARPVTIGRTTLSPHNVNRIRGRALNTVAAADILNVEEL